MPAGINRDRATLLGPQAECYVPNAADSEAAARPRPRMHWRHIRPSDPLAAEGMSLLKELRDLEKDIRTDSLLSSLPQDLANSLRLSASGNSYIVAGPTF
jgi:hypothetical protein